jgi:carboxyl-terminal processing protease
MATGPIPSLSDENCLATSGDQHRFHGRPASRRRLHLACGALALLGLLGGVAIPAGADPEVQTFVMVETRKEHNLRVFAITWEWVNSHYYDSTFNGVDWDAARATHLAEAEAAGDTDELYAVLARMVSRIGDMHTQVLSPREVRDQGGTHRALLGFVSRPVEDAADKWTIVGVMPGSPAAGAGVQPGWTLDACDGLPPAAVLGTGTPLEAGRAVLCEFSDESDQTHTLTIAAGTVASRAIRESRRLDGGQHYVRFDEFDSNTAAWLRGELHRHAGASGLVLDLRFNPGGEVGVLEEVAGEFFSETVELGSLVSRDGDSDTLVSRRAADAATVKGRVAVLVAAESMSCAEIFAGAMQHHRRAIVLGGRTAGMVLGSVGVPLPGGGELQLSVWDYRTPAGERIERVGVSPDITLDRSIELAAGIDAAVSALATTAHSAGTH